MYTKKEVAVQLSKRRCTRVKRQALGSYKGEGARVARSHPLFSVRKKYFFTLKTLLAPPNAIGLHRP